MNFGNDSFLWYNVGAWADLGLAVPNWSDDIQSQNDGIRELTQVVGRNLQNIMFHTDARLTTPPSINTLIRIHRLIVRSRALLASRQVPANVRNLESRHALPAPEVHLVYPTPYFRVRNSQMRKYCGYILLALTEALQHTENAKPIEISEDFAGLFGQYLHRVYRLMAVEMFQVPRAEAEDPAFTLTDEHLASYDPGQWFTSTEMIDTVPDLTSWPTEDDLRVITSGIPVAVLPKLGRWPGLTVGGRSEASAAAGAEGSAAFARPPQA